MRKAFHAGLAYSAAVFAAGFALGAARVLLVAPRLGEMGAVLLELPVILAVSWWTCGGLARRFAVPSAPGDRLVMGLVAFVALQTAEVLLAVLAFGRSPVGYLAGLITPAGGIGLAGQIVFALFPLVRRRG